MKMYMSGKWVDKAETMPVLNPFDQSVIDTVPKANAAEVEQAITSAARGAGVMGKMTAYELKKHIADLKLKVVKLKAKMEQEQSRGKFDSRLLRELNDSKEQLEKAQAESRKR